MFELFFGESDSFPVHFRGQVSWCDLLFFGAKRIAFYSCTLAFRVQADQRFHASLPYLLPAISRLSGSSLSLDVARCKVKPTPFHDGRFSVRCGQKKALSFESL